MAAFPAPRIEPYLSLVVRPGSLNQIGGPLGKSAGADFLGVNRRAKRGERGGQPPPEIGLVLRPLGEAGQGMFHDLWDAALGSLVAPRAVRGASPSCGKLSGWLGG
jgi:hypothetical protein